MKNNFHRIHSGILLFICIVAFSLSACADLPSISETSSPPSSPSSPAYAPIDAETGAISTVPTFSDAPLTRLPPLITEAAPPPVTTPSDFFPDTVWQTTPYEDGPLNLPAQPEYCVHHIFLLDSDYAESSYHTIPYSLIAANGGFTAYQNWREKVSAEPGGNENVNIVRFLRDFAITKEQFTAYWHVDAGMYYGDYDPDILYGQDAEAIEAYYHYNPSTDSSRIDALKEKAWLYRLKTGMTFYFDHEKAAVRDKWTAEKNASAQWKYAASLNEFSTDNPRLWSIAEAVDYFDISRETLESICTTYAPGLTLDLDALYAKGAYQNAVAAAHATDGLSPDPALLDMRLVRSVG